MNEPSVVTGTYMDRSLHNFCEACSHYIREEQRTLAPDHELIALLADGIRLTRELTVCEARRDAWIRHELARQGVEPRRAGAIPAAHDTARETHRMIDLKAHMRKAMDDLYRLHDLLAQIHLEL